MDPIQDSSQRLDEITNVVILSNTKLLLPASSYCLSSTEETELYEGNFVDVQYNNMSVQNDDNEIIHYVLRSNTTLLHPTSYGLCSCSS